MNVNAAVVDEQGASTRTRRRTAKATASRVTPLQSDGRLPANKFAWDDMKVALAVSRAGSLSRAAEVLGVDPATVSRRIATLENALGETLFSRSKIGVMATDAGKAVIGRASEIEHRMLLMEEEIAAMGTARGAVRVVGGMWMMARMAVAAAPILRDQHPELTMRLIAARPPVELPSGLPSVSLWCETLPKEDELALTLGDAPYSCYARADLDPRDLPLLGHRNETGAADAPDRWASERRETDHDTPLMATDSAILKDAVKAGLGKALLPMSIARDEPTLKRVTSGEPDLVRQLKLHVQPDVIQFTRVRILVDVLRVNFEEIFGAGPQG